MLQSQTTSAASNSAPKGAAPAQPDTSATAVARKHAGQSRKAISKTAAADSYDLPAPSQAQCKIKRAQPAARPAAKPGAKYAAKRASKHGAQHAAGAQNTAVAQQADSAEQMQLDVAPAKARQGRKRRAACCETSVAELDGCVEAQEGVDSPSKKQKSCPNPDCKNGSKQLSVADACNIPRFIVCMTQLCCSRHAVLQLCMVVISHR